MHTHNLSLHFATINKFAKYMQKHINESFFNTLKQ